MNNNEIKMTTKDPCLPEIFKTFGSVWLIQRYYNDLNYY